MALRPVLIVEGPGDMAAVPLLVRRISAAEGCTGFETASRPKANVDIGKLLRPGEIERFIDYCRREPLADSILIVLDCDDRSATDAYAEFKQRISSVVCRRPTAVVLFRREFETMFLYSMPEIIARYPDFKWHQTATIPPDAPDSIRGVKEYISKLMPKDKAYKETRDQPRFTSAVNLSKLIHYGAFCRLRDAIRWLADQPPDSIDVFDQNP